MAAHVSFDDLRQPSLANIAKRMKTCQIRPSNIQEGNLGLFNASGETIGIDTVFQILSHGKLHAGNPVRMRRLVCLQNVLCVMCSCTELT